MQVELELTVAETIELTEKVIGELEEPDNNELFIKLLSNDRPTDA
jgi:hypothetical protein